MGVLVVRDADHWKPADSDLAVYEALVSECAAVDFRLHLCGARSFDYIYGAVRFSKTENVLAVVKTAAIFMFIVIAILALCGIFSHKPDVQVPNESKDLFPHGAMGLWTGLIYAFYAFGGIEVLGLMTVHLKKPEEASKSGRLMLAVLAVIYVISLGLASLLVPLGKFTEQDSPFITSLKGFHLDIILDIFNGIFIIAGFSTLVASLFAVTTLLCTMADDGDAPKCFRLKENKKSAGLRSD